MAIRTSQVISEVSHERTDNTLIVSHVAAEVSHERTDAKLLVTHVVVEVGHERADAALKITQAFAEVGYVLCANSMSIIGPSDGDLNVPYEFTAVVVAPSDISYPYVYAWSPEPDLGQGTAQATYEWSSGGTYVLTLSFTNGGVCNLIIQHSITIIQLGRLDITMYTTGPTTLRGKKAPYARRWNTFEPFAWLGKCARIGGADVPKGDMNVSYKHSSQVGQYEFDQEWESAPGPSTTSILMKETIKNALYDDLDKCKFNLDIRTLLCGNMDDPTNWSMIKRFHEARITNISTDDETAYSPDDEGETVITGSVSTREAPVILYPVAGQRVDDLNLQDSHLSRISTCRGDRCPDDCGPGGDCKLVAVVIDASPSNPPKYGVSTDGGTNWTVSTITEFTTASVLTDIACYEDLMVAVASGEPGYAVSWDAGATWTLVDDSVVSAFTTNAPLSVAVYSFNNIIIGGENGYVWQSLDGGLTLQARDEGVVTIQDVTRIRFFSELVIYAAGDGNSLKRSVNGGKSWTLITLDASKAADDVGDVLPLSTNRILVGYKTTGGVWYTQDGGTTWIEDTSVASTVQVYSLVNCGHDDMYLAGAYGGAGVVYRNVDGGSPNRWLVQAIDDPGTVYYDIACCRNNHVVAIGAPSGVYSAGVVTVFEAT